MVSGLQRDVSTGRVDLSSRSIQTLPCNVVFSSLCHWINKQYHSSTFFAQQGNADSLPMEMCSTCKYQLKMYQLRTYQLCTNDRKNVLTLFSDAVDADEIKRLGKRFRKLDLDNSGSLSIDEFMSLPELQQNPLVQRVIDIFDTDGNGEVDFKGNKVFFLVPRIHRLFFPCRIHSRRVAI